MSEPATVRDPRFVNVPGSLNLRDFGGYETADGRRVKQGLLFRCGALNGIAPDHHHRFAALDIGVICDLRREDEAALSPTPEQPPFDVRVHIPIMPGSHQQMRDSYADPTQTHEDRIRFMTRITREIARDHVAEYQQLFRELVNVDNGFLLHCSAGKDRTGFGAAAIQVLLGVPEATIFEDYLLTNRAHELLERMKPRMQAQHDTLDDESIKVLAGVREEYLAAAFDEIHQVFGGFDGYFEALGLDAADIRQLREKYLAP